MNQRGQYSTGSLKTQLNAFFKTEAFRRAAILHTIAVLSSRSSHDWWSVDLDTGKVIHRATKAVYPDYRFPGVLSLEMLTDADLHELQLQAGLSNLDVLIRANREHPHGAGLEHLPPEAQDQLTRLAAELEKHPEMLVLIKRLMRQQL
jgi:hypothetical protein